MSAGGVRGEWEAERGRGRGIVVRSNGGFPPPVSQERHVTRPEEEFRGRLEGGLDSIDQLVNQSHFVFSSSMVCLTALQQFRYLLGG